MASFQGQLLKGGQVLYQVSGRLQFQSREGIRVWGGHFTLPLRGAESGARTLSASPR